MVKGAVDAAVGGEAHQVELLSALFHRIVCRLDFLVLKEFVLTAGNVDLDKILVNYAAGAKVHMTNLTVTHLAVRETYVFTAGLKMAVRIFLTEGVNVGRALGPDCV